MSSDDGADEGVVVAIIPKRSNKQRQDIKKAYEQKYKKVSFYFFETFDKV